MSKDKKVNKNDKVVKEKDVIKKSDYEDSNDNKKIVVVALILALLIGSFAYVRSLDDKKEEKEPVEDVLDQEQEEEEVDEPVVSDNNNVQNNYTSTTTPSEPVVVDIWEALNNILTTVEAGGELGLPEIKATDNGTEITAVVSYMYRETEDVEYTSIEELDTTKIGQYLITYTLSYQDGTVETKEVVITVVDTTEPVINNIKDGSHYNDESILLDITEFSPYTVELNGAEYDPSVPITEEGTYTITVTENTELGSRITVTFVIDRTKPVITLTPNEEGIVTIDVIEDNLDTFVITKDGVEVNLTEMITEEGEYKIVATDKAGNSAEEILTIDATAPTVEVTYTPDNNELTSEQVTVEITANEEIQEVEGWVLSEDRLTLTKVFDENTTELVEVKDIAGNVTEVNVVVNNIDYNVVYTPELTIENMVANQVKATITSLKQLTFAEEIQNEWKETFDEESGIYTYEKIYTEAKDETLEYTYESDDEETISGEIKISISGVTIVDTLVTYEIDDETQNVKVSIITDEEVTNLPEGWARDDEYMAEDYKYYKVYTENVEYEVVEFATENTNYVAAITVDSIDRVSPSAEATVTYEEENDEKKSVTVTVAANEEIKEVEGWILSDDKKSISRKIDRPEIVTEEVIDEKVTITDLRENTTEVEYSYNWNIESSTE